MQTGGLGTPSGSLRRKQQIKMPKANAINSKSDVMDAPLWKKNKKQNKTKNKKRSKKNEIVFSYKALSPCRGFKGNPDLGKFLFVGESGILGLMIRNLESHR